MDFIESMAVIDGAAHDAERPGRAVGTPW